MPQIRDTNVRINDCVYTEFTAMKWTTTDSAACR